MVPLLTTIPLELRYMIMEYVLGTKQKTLHIAPRNLFERSSEWDEPPPPRERWDRSRSRSWSRSPHHSLDLTQTGDDSLEQDSSSGNGDGGGEDVHSDHGQTKEDDDNDDLVLDDGKQVDQVRSSSSEESCSENEPETRAGNNLSLDEGHDVDLNDSGDDGVPAEQNGIDRGHEAHNSAIAEHRDVNYRGHDRRYDRRYDRYIDRRLEHRKESPWRKLYRERDAHQRDVISGIESMVSLMKVNRQLHAEAHDWFHSKVVADFQVLADLRSSSSRTARVQGLDRASQAYTSLTAQNTFLKDNLQNFRAITLELHLSQEMLEQDDHAELRTWLYGYWCVLDNLRLLVVACNASRSLRKVELCCIIEQEDRDSRHKNVKLQRALSPFEKLRADIDLRVHVHINGEDEYGEWDGWDMHPHETGFPVDIWAGYISSLETRRTALPAEWLIDDWIRLRAWLEGTMPSLTQPLRRGYDLDMRTKLALKYSDVPWELSHSLRDIMRSAWNAHDLGDRPAFQAAKQELKAWSVELCSRRIKAMMEGLSSEDEAVAFAPDRDERRGSVDSSYY